MLTVALLQKNRMHALTMHLHWHTGTSKELSGNTDIKRLLINLGYFLLSVSDILILI